MTNIGAFLSVSSIRNWPRVLDRTGLSRSTLYRKMQTGAFPKNVKISTRCAGWRQSAVEEWLRDPMFYETTNNLL